LNLIDGLKNGTNNLNILKGKEHIELQIYQNHNSLYIPVFIRINSILFVNIQCALSKKESTPYSGTSFNLPLLPPAHHILSIYMLFLLSKTILLHRFYSYGDASLSLFRSPWFKQNKFGYHKKLPMTFILALKNGFLWILKL